MTISPENVTLLEGEEGSLECQVSSNPANVSVVWFHHQQELEIDGNKYSETQSDSGTFLLVISNLSSTDSGEFSCSAENTLGVGTSDNIAMMDVLCECFKCPVNSHNLNFRPAHCLRQL